MVKNKCFDVTISSGRNDTEKRICGRTKQKVLDKAIKEAFKLNDIRIRLK